ncbi:MAG: Maf family protein [Porticoccaceae bacterium]|nr:septum formation inhibitor Maf [Pseudomonadales bacterium]MCP5173374.1 septum formation inhibitor Maf [Pseudomonadales bacterium]MCP5303186.1 septum formation inhibitor Maf [Pseudomonadales bacterium]
MTLSADFILSSASPRRRDLLKQIGARFIVQPVFTDETVFAGESPVEYVTRMAETKASAGWRASNQSLPVMAADTAVVLAQKIFGKPENQQQALQTLQFLSGTTHRVLSGVAICQDERIESLVSETLVTFRHLDRDEMERYWQTGEPADKAGAYAIQGAGAVFVDKIEGSYSGVVGLPVAETTQLMRRFGIPWWQQW